MSLCNDIVKSIEVKVNNSNLTSKECGKILKECTSVLRNLYKRFKRSKSNSEKAHISSCIGQIKGFQRILKDKKVGRGSGIRRSETACCRVKWDDIESAFQSRIRTGVITNMRHTDVKPFLGDCSILFKRRIANALKNDEALKINTVLSALFRNNKGDKMIEEVKYLNTRNVPIYRGTDLESWFSRNIAEPLLADLDEFQERDSGFALSRVLNLTIHINKFNPLRVGSYIELPREIARKKACINVRNSDEMCFVWAVVSALYPASIHTSSTSSYPEPTSVLNLKGIQFPITLRQIPRFETQNNLSINVYRIQKYQKKFQVLPHFLTQKKQDKHVNLLLIQDSYIDDDTLDDLIPIKFHYIWIKNLSRLLALQLSKKHNQKYFCDRCLHYYYSKEKLNKHVLDCIKIKNVVVPQVPKNGMNIIEFKNFNQKEKIPFIIYADAECLLIPIEVDRTMNTQRTQQHIPYSVGYYVKCSYDDSLSFYKTYTGKDCMEWFVKELKEFAEDVETVFQCPLPMESLTAEEWISFWEASQCHVCEEPFPLYVKKVRDHCHLTGKYRGPAHEWCNLNYQDSRVVPVVFHNLSCYDGHMIIKALNEIEGKIDILPVNKEKYISFTKHIEDSTIQFRFLDSFRFLPSKLDQLVTNLSDYPNVKKETEDQLGLLTRKGIFPYDYMNSWEKLKTSELPSKHEFYNSLEDKYVSDKEYAHAQNIWYTFKCRSMQDYSDLYLKTDVLLLADVFEEFRKTSHKTYGIDPAHSFTLPGYAWQCLMYKMYRENQTKIELLTDYEMIRFIERGIRGGLSQCSKRYAEANNKYMPSYDETKEEVYLAYFDVNNQYGWAMSQYLPYGEFKWLDEDLNVLDISDEAERGYILEVDLEIPLELHDKFTDLPPCPEHRRTEKSKTVKLLATLHNKKNYIIHYRNLKQVLELGVKVNKIHRILAFRQSPWLKSYIDLNTKLRQTAKNDFEKNLFKLMNNAVFGKTMENLRNHSIVKLISSWDGRYSAEALISRPEFKSSTIINENLVIVELAKSNVFFNKPIYVGMCILDLAKTTIYDFHYNYMNRCFSDCKVLYTDTDSLIYEIKNDNLYDKIKLDCQKYFDTSDYPCNNIYNIPKVNKKVLGLMKDENNGRIMTHFIGLRSKMYSTKVLYSAEEIEAKKIELKKEEKERLEIDDILKNLGITKKIKGVKKSVIENTITFDDYVDCLETFNEKHITQKLIRSRKHELYTTKQSKIGLSPHDDKRRVIKGICDTLPWGHCNIMEE